MAKRIKIPLNKSFSGTEYRAMGHALYYLLSYKGGAKSATYEYMASPKSIEHLKKLASEWLNAYEVDGGDVEVTMSLPTEVQEAILSFMASTVKPKVKKAKKLKSLEMNPVPIDNDIPF